MKGRAYEDRGKKNEDVSIVEAKQRLCEIIRKPVDFDWEANEYYLPNIDGLRLSVFNKSQRIYLTPFSNYYYTFGFGVGSAGWNVATEKGEVRNGLYEITFRLTKGEESILKTFQIGGVRRHILGGNKKRGNVNDQREKRWIERVRRRRG